MSFRRRTQSWRCAVAIVSLATVGCSEQKVAQVAGVNQTEATTSKKAEFSFEAPVRLTAADGPVRVESPGYASPCWADIDADGNKDLLVGQFSGGKIRVFKNLGQQELAAGEWLEAGGSVAEVPGVW